MADSLRLFLIAMQFLTRLPAPKSLDTTQEQLGRASRFFPLIGVLVGAFAALVFLSARNFLPHSPSVFCALAFAALLTNGFHEDGLADSFDGFGGGWTRERTLEIMRDSRLGTYGVLSLIFLILGKYTFLSVLPPSLAWRSLIVAHVAGRWTVLPLCLWLPYARQEGQGGLVAQRIGVVELLIGSATLLAACFLFSLRQALACLAACALVTYLSGRYYRSRLGGITGDCLGATNQLTELAVYLITVIRL
jgi:adenosylcobinamide-GDP ribazoletransferase